MKCYLRYLLLGGLADDVTRYPAECFAQHTQTCLTASQVSWELPTELNLPSAGGYWWKDVRVIPTFAVAIAHSWNHTNWSVRVHGGTTCATIAQSGVLTATNTSVGVVGWPGGNVWFQLATTHPSPQLTLQLVMI